MKAIMKRYSRLRTLLPALAIFLVLLESMPAFGLSNGWPVPYGSITSVVGWRRDPFGSGKLKWHNGIDIAVPLYTPVTPTAPGLVRYAGWHHDYGWLVVVDHHNGWFTMYGHNYTLAVRIGEEVTPDTVIAYAGSTGRSTGVHVHYEQRWFPQGTIHATGADGRSAQGEKQPTGEAGPSGATGYDFTSPGGLGGE